MAAMSTFSDLVRGSENSKHDMWNPACSDMGIKQRKPKVPAREAFKMYITPDGLIDVQALSSKQRREFLSYITVSQIEISTNTMMKERRMSGSCCNKKNLIAEIHHLERMSGETRCDSMTTHNDCKRKLNKIRRHAKEHLSQFLNDDGFLELSRLSAPDKELLISCVSESQLDAFIEAFETFDMNDDASISSSELRVVLKSLGIEPTEEVLHEILSEVDADGNGVVDVQEFLIFMASRTLYKDEDQNIRDAFKQFDKDGNGYIDKDELISLMESLGQKLTEKEIDEMMQDADFDRDGKISYQEFYIMMKLAY